MAGLPEDPSERHRGSILDTRDGTSNHVEDEHPVFWFKDNVLMACTMTSVRLRLCVKRSAEVVTAATTINDSQFWNLFR